jgi:hypothetical protein
VTKKLIKLLDEKAVTEVQQTIVDVFRGASNVKANCDDAICAWICGVLGKFADAQNVDFVKLITTIIKYAPPGYTPPDRKKLAGPLLDVQDQRTKEKVNELLNQLEGMCGLTFVSDGHSDKSMHPIVSYLCCTPKGSIHLGVDDFSGEARDCISQAKRMAERMTATGKERGFSALLFWTGGTVAAAAAAPTLYKQITHRRMGLATAGLSIYRAPWVIKRLLWAHPVFSFFRVFLFAKSGLSLILFPCLPPPSLLSLSFFPFLAKEGSSCSNRKRKSPNNGAHNYAYQARSGDSAQVPSPSPYHFF